jgi:MSHA pilin protein MshA
MGFTLIELVVVIVILGILAIVALPRFADQGKEARIAALKSLEGSILSAAHIVHAKALIQNKTDCATDPTVTVEGRTVTLRCGYPCPHPSGIANAVDAHGFTWVGGNCGGQLGAIDVRLTDAPDPSRCQIRYASARQNRAPTLTKTTSGC